MFCFFLLLVVFFGFIGVVFGVFVVYGLKKQLSVEYLVVFQIGVYYQLIYVLVLFGVVLFVICLDGCLVSVVGGLFMLGILLFFGSFYLLILSGIGKFGIVILFGGVFFFVGWLCLGLVVWCLGNV